MPDYIACLIRDVIQEEQNYFRPTLQYQWAKKNLDQKLLDYLSKLRLAIQNRKFYEFKIRVDDLPLFQD